MGKFRGLKKRGPLKRREKIQEPVKHKGMPSTPRKTLLFLKPSRNSGGRENSMSKNDEGSTKKRKKKPVTQKNPHPDPAQRKHSLSQVNISTEGQEVGFK